MPWTVVKFLTTNEVEAIPTSWIDKNGKTCFYPAVDNTSIIKKYIKNEVDPGDDWQQYAIDIMTSEEFTTFKIASMKASRACVISDLDENVYTPLPEKRPRKKKHFSESSSDSEESLKGLPNFPKKGNAIYFFSIVNISMF